RERFNPRRRRPGTAPARICTSSSPSSTAPCPTARSYKPRWSTTACSGDRSAAKGTRRHASPMAGMIEMSLPDSRGREHKPGGGLRESVDLKPAIRTTLDKIVADTSAYRRAMDKVLHGTLATPGAWRRQLGSVLGCLAELVLDYLVLMRNRESLEAVARSMRSSRSSREEIKTRAEREASMRKDLAAVLGTSGPWQGIYTATPPWFAAIGLRTRHDCARVFVVHLPEIYGETLCVDAHIARFRRSRD